MLWVLKRTISMKHMLNQIDKKVLSFLSLVVLLSYRLFFLIKRVYLFRIKVRLLSVHPSFMCLVNASPSKPLDVTNFVAA